MTTRRYWTMPAAVMAAMLLTFALVEALGVESLSDPRPLLDAGGVLAGVTGIGLVVADVFLPVPSSAVMLAYGALFGIVVGAAVGALYDGVVPPSVGSMVIGPPQARAAP